MPQGLPSRPIRSGHVPTRPERTQARLGQPIPTGPQTALGKGGEGGGRTARGGGLAAGATAATVAATSVVLAASAAGSAATGEALPRLGKPRHQRR